MTDAQVTAREEAQAAVLEEARAELQGKIDLMSAQMDGIDEGFVPIDEGPTKKSKVQKGRKGGLAKLEKLNQRARSIERFSGWKYLIMVSKLPLITGHEMKLIIQIFDILLDGVLEDDTEKDLQVFEAHKMEAELVMELIMKYNDFYLALTSTSISESEVLKLGKMGSEVADLYAKSPLIKYALTDFKTRKFHWVFNHSIDTIRRYGSLACYLSILSLLPLSPHPFPSSPSSSYPSHSFP